MSTPIVLMSQPRVIPAHMMQSTRQIKTNTVNVCGLKELGNVETTAVGCVMLLLENHTVIREFVN